MTARRVSLLAASALQERTGMYVYPVPAPLPSADKRWKLVEATMRRHGYKATALLEVLHTVQESFGYLDDVSLRFVAKSLRVPLSKVYGVATFYHYFTLKPQGQHTCVVCMGTGCYVKGAGDLVKAIEETAHVKPGETTPDGQISVVAARCIGACSLAPAVVLDGEVISRAQPNAIRESFRRWTRHAA
jgi:bidirectional [NiFe] hydrogenase diaphorase subunit